ncbi:lissencephaly-1 [Anaeramoeba ignava]|uniref:Lissencephaly-1 homolog n=1 Tax=Anaeramoeba ignava TaxID=1746090 RepID=A0A9Q0LN10_ANAIG|nr:lissencephaly-1 [Anaeramoeba ignava]|eukprot:Anaeramoba_ignava/a219356_49.p2 GENE.a219356_49~~a219356_49.p2  ORF type:complete len:415 (-),score=123.09 a219356_49:1701-2945(-)
MNEKKKIRSTLSNKQQKELFLSIFGYLEENNFKDAAKEFAVEAKIENEKAKKGLLERKWNSIIRLQRKIVDLENQITRLQDDLSHTSLGQKQETKTDFIPTSPAKIILKGHKSPIMAVKYHPVFSLVATVSEDATTKIWDIESGEMIESVKGHTNIVQDIDWNEDGKFLVTSSADMSVKVYDSQRDWNCIKTLTGHEHNVSGVAFVPKKPQVISCSRDNTIKLWDFSTGLCLFTFEDHDDWVRRVAVNSDGTIFASCSNDKTARIWDLASNKCISVLSGHENVVECLAFSPQTTNEFIEIKHEKNSPFINNPFLATGSRDKSIRIWNLETKECVLILSGHENWVRSIVFHPCGKFLISVSDDRSIKIWDLSNSRCIRTINDAHDHFVQALDMNKKLPQIATGSVDCLIKIWNCN